jgi:DNA-binding transcriptional ArsR family regulator
MQMIDAVGALASLAHESRLAVFRHLVEAGAEGDTPGRLAARLGISPSTLSFHLKELANAGLVTSRSESRFLIYSVDFGRMAALMAFLTHNCCKGMPDECLSTMETALSRCCAPSPHATAKRGAR